MIYTFGEFELDTERYELRRNGEPRKVEPRVFDLIAHFAGNAGQVFSRDALIAAVWRGRVVSDATVSTCIKSARKALGDSGDSQRYIETVRGRGFRFAETVKTVDSAAGNGPTETAGAPALRRGSDPSLLILPFRSLSDDPEAVRIAEALGSDLGTILTRVPLLRLSTETSKYEDREIAPGAREIHEELGVDYVLSGQLQARDGGYRINVELTDAKSGFRLWAEQISVKGTAESALDELVIAVIAKLEPQLHRAIYDTVRAGDGEPTARELFLEASSVLALKGWHHDSFSKAADLLRRSCELDPDFALASAYLALVTGLGERIGLLGDREQVRAEALEAAERAMSLDNMDSTVLGFSGCALADIGFPERAAPILKNAVELNPANAQAWAALGSVCLLQQQIGEAVRHLAHGIHISPMDSRLSLWGAMLAIALMQSGDLEGALDHAEVACQRDHRSYLPRVVLAGVQLLRKEPDRAAGALAEAARIYPDLGPRQILPLLGPELGARVQSLG